MTKHLVMMDYEEFYEEFWGDVKTPSLASINDAFITEELSTSQKQAIITLTKKRQIRKIY